ncbi:GHMP kinase [Veillonella intestinalis]|uniref:GHMP family kinase ATP-binding protein n=1 Tax=Veillonella intestinalis TaxID=2941341 RepID=UPI00204045AD|nr:GHMP kinase [Veillonella intestinalis]
MSYYVRAPGTCGEFLQGSIDGQPFLVTCPINRYSYALSEVKQPLRPYFCSLQPKAALAAQQVKRLLMNERPFDSVMWSQETPGPTVYVRSDIVQGKGMASSSADISVAAMATALAHGRPLTLEELKDICLSIEPSDASFYPGVVQFDYISGVITEPLGQCPPMKIMIFDEGGEIDTVAFNAQVGLHDLIAEKEPYILESLALFKEGLAQHNVSLIGQAATLSAFANQRILYKPLLYEFHEIGNHFNSVGTIIAHSGTIMGLLFPSDGSPLADCRAAVQQALPTLHYLDTVETTNEGITFMKR